MVHDEDAPLVSSICKRLDGIPLALELAAARLSSMSLSQLHERLDQRFRLLTGGSRNVMARQQTLQALVDWSYGLLSPAEQSVLRRLSVFVGGFTLEAAEAVCSSELVDEFDVANVLHSLVAKSLVVADQGHRSVRFRLLETIRQYQRAARSCSTPKATRSPSTYANVTPTTSSRCWPSPAGRATTAPPITSGPGRWTSKGRTFRAMLSRTARHHHRGPRTCCASSWRSAGSFTSRASYDWVPFLSDAIKRSGDARNASQFANAPLTAGPARGLVLVAR